MAKKFEEMTDEEKQAAFEKYMKNREARRGTSGIRRAATKALIKAHQPEFNDLVAKLGGKAPAPVKR